MTTRRSVLVLFLGAVVAATGALEVALAAAPATEKSPPLYVGLRRSSYGLRKKNADDAWWVERAKTFAARFPGSTPLVLQIVSGYQESDGSTEMEFAKPVGYSGETAHMTFRAGAIDHERALGAYDAAGVKAVLQFESGSADPARCIEAAWLQFKHHPCVAGLALDAEWYFTRQSADKTGRPIADADARKWMEQVLALRSDLILVLKHWDPKHMPPAYRHPNLWLLSDSQKFADQSAWLANLAAWGKAFQGSTVGFQFGYPKDRPWWSKLDAPPVTLGKVLTEQVPSCRCLLWVDFTADEVEFAAKAG